MLLLASAFGAPAGGRGLSEATGLARLRAAELECPHGSNGMIVKMKADVSARTADPTAAPTITPLPTLAPPSKSGGDDDDDGSMVIIIVVVVLVVVLAAGGGVFFMMSKGGGGQVKPSG